MAYTKAGIILYCNDGSENKYLLAKETKWVEDLIQEPEKKGWKITNQTTNQATNVTTKADAAEYFKARRIEDKLLSSKSVHRSHIKFNKKYGAFTTKWVYADVSTVYGFIKGKIEDCDKEQACKNEPKCDVLPICAKREFCEETLSNLDELGAVYENEIDVSDYRFFVYKTTCDVIEKVIQKFNENKRTNNGDGAEPSELKLVTKKELADMIQKRQTNYPTFKSFEKIKNQIPLPTGGKKRATKKSKLLKKKHPTKRRKHKLHK